MGNRWDPSTRPAGLGRDDDETIKIFMFDEQNKNSGVEDILATTEAPAAPQEAGPLGPPTALAQGKLQPIQPSAPQAAVPVGQLSGAPATSFPLKKILVFVVVFLVVGGGAAAGYFWWQGRSSEGPLGPIDMPLSQPNNEPAAAPAAENAPESNSINQAVGQFQQDAINQVVDPFAKPAPENNIPAGAPAVDTDQDGLNDTDEKTYGTNINLGDTDGDGLSDWEEVTVFGTNPLDPDTDADTYSDGSEVQKGYNPKGQGKLLDFEQAKSVTP